ncbi:uncharacterized protein [Littorina saxatilis]|uniref:uncharacterized protein n=1 Tax=Littorina saxatilis TaxID=31220 RepID=UPI0038B6199C
MAFFPMWPACYVIFLLIQHGVVTASEGACTRLDDSNGTRVSCNWQNNMCDSESRNLSYPNWECFAASASGPWSMIYTRSKTVELASPWLCPTGLIVYTLSFHFQAPQDLLPEQLELFVIKGPESLQRALESSQANFSSNFSPMTGIWFGNVSVSCPDCKFQIKFRTSLPGNVSLLNISMDTGVLPPEHFSTDKFYATWIAGIVILLVAAVVAVACFIFWWRKKGRALGAEEGGGDEGTTDVGRDDTDSGMDSGGSAATTGIAVSSNNGSAGSAQRQQAKNNGDNPPSLQRDGAMPSPSHDIIATPKPSPVSEENQYSAPDGENYDHGYYLEPIADPHATPEPDVTGENLYDVPEDESPPLPYRPPDLRRK